MMLIVAGSFVMHLYSPTYKPSKIQSLGRKLYHIDVLQINSVSDARLLQASVHIFLIITRST
jgi:hypothetical protein